MGTSTTNGGGGASGASGVTCFHGVGDGVASTGWAMDAEVVRVTKTPRETEERRTDGEQ